MHNLVLLTLDLRASFDYRGIENPPIRGAPFGGPLSGSLALDRGVLGWSDGASETPELAVGEELFVFDAEALVAFDPDDGPRVRRPLPPPGYYGRRRAGPSAPAAPGEETRPTAFAEGAYSLARGTYLFMQFRPLDEAALAEGLEWFAREAWWEGSPGRGPYIVRRLREDGELAAQVMRMK